MQVGSLMSSGQHAHAAAIVESAASSGSNSHEIDVWRLKIAAARQDPLRLLRVAERLLEAQPGNPQLIFNRILALYFLGRLDDAIAIIDQELPSANPQYRHNLIALRYKALLRHGSTDELRTLLAQLITTEGTTPRIVDLEIDLLQREGKLDEAIERSNEILQRSGLAFRERTTATLHLARLLDRCGRYDEAFEAARSVNEQPPQHFSAEQYVTETQAQISYFTADRVRSLPRSSITTERPVFIVGMPRSGTSVLEQIVASHPQGDGLGERQDPLILSEDLCVELGNTLPEVLATTSSNTLDSYATRYLSTFNDTEAHGDRVVNKSLGLDQLVGFLTVLLPGARFIWIHRTPADNILSIYLHHISKPWAWRLEDLIVARKSHDLLRTHWLEVDPDRHLAVEYEELTNHQARETNRILDFLGLPHDERTLSFHENPRAVMTPSAGQVKQPMNRNAVNRWKNYAKYLRPVLDAFAESSDDSDAPS